MVELAKDSEVNLIFILDGVGELAGLYPGYDIIRKGVDNSYFCSELSNLQVG
jgi:hypothetical protein